MGENASITNKCFSKSYSASSKDSDQGQKIKKSVVFHQPNQADTENKRIIFTPSVCIGNRSQGTEARSQKPGVRSQEPEYKAETASTDSVLFYSEFWILSSALLLLTR
jgi:hypothetical protein